MGQAISGFDPSFVLVSVRSQFLVFAAFRSRLVGRRFGCALI